MGQFCGLKGVVEASCVRQPLFSLALLDQTTESMPFNWIAIPLRLPRLGWWFPDARFEIELS